MSKKEEIINYFKDKIEKKELIPGDKLPSETELADEFNVSRTTLRLALNDLAMENIIERKLGDGTYITERSHTKKFIIISLNNIYSKDNIFYTYQFVTSRLREILTKKGYKVFVYNSMEDISFFDIINIPPDNIAGWISVNSNFEPEPDLYNIPKVNCITFIDEEHFCVTINPCSIFSKIDYLINKYELKNSLIFYHKQDEQEITFNKIFNCGIENYFGHNHITIPVAGDYTSKDRKDIMQNNIIRYLNDTDTIIFSDDTFYKQIYPFLNKNRASLKGKKIITHTNYPDNDIYGEEVCQLRFDLNRLCEETINIILKIIAKEYIAKPHLLLPVEIINEEIFHQ